MTRQRLSEVLCAGETMALVTPKRTERLRLAEEFHLDVGGAESNVATHLVALGRPSRWFSRLGEDELGRRVADHIGRRGVDLKGVVFDTSRPTGVYFKDPGRGVIYYRAGSAASALSHSDAQDLDLGGVGLIHLSGITPALSSTAAQFIETLMTRAAAVGIQVSFDVNYRPGLWSKDVAARTLKSFAERADVVLVGLDESELLWGTRTPSQVRELFPEVPALVVKDSDVGATEFTARSSHFEKAIPTEVVEVVGAGDAFAAGYLHGYLAGDDSAVRLRSGHLRSILTLQTTTDFISEGAPDADSQ